LRKAKIYHLRNDLGTVKFLLEHVICVFKRVVDKQKYFI